MPPDTASEAASADARVPVATAAAAAPPPRTAPPPAGRPLRPALRRGWRRRCPACGRGRLFRGYLAVRDACEVCGEALHHQRADDGPAYLTVLVVGHLMAPALLWGHATFRPDPLLLATTVGLGAIALSLWLLPRVKGAIVAFQWARRLHGFGDGRA
jgi:uncharacterized protein (DUF983 family)